MLLSQAFENINKKYSNIKFNKIRFDSRECKPNDIFFAIKGNRSNGNNFINKAIKNGAKIVISNLSFQGFNNKKVLFVRCSNPQILLGDVAKKIYKKKPQNIIGVTGTNGKTSINNFYYQILKNNKKSVASIGTLGVISKKLKMKTNNTTVDVINIHKILDKLKSLKVNNVILEASSHGLKQLRLNGINFNTAIFTNLTRDHLDYHKSFKDYLNSKLTLFNNLLNNNGNIIFSGDIPQAKYLNKISKKKKLKKFIIGSDKSSFYILKIQKIGDQKKIDFSFNKRKYSFKTSLIGNLQIKNLTFAIIAAYLSNIRIEKILQTINKIKPINGRLEKIGSLKNNAVVILDYAHTPDALKLSILNIKEDFPNSRVSIVFGCGGNRDKNKRGIMGRIADKYCDYIYLTDDNPRNENPRAIRNQIKKEIKKNKYIEIPSRADAINKSIEELKSGDILIVAGKGHENYQEFKKKVFFSDRYEILKSIKKKNIQLSNSIKTNIINENINKSINKKILLKSASMNSKTIKKNSLFIGVKGKKFDGNNFTNEAINRGCSLAISNIKNKEPKVIFKRNPLKYFENICQIYRKSLNAVNIAITGSVGKTSVKELTSFSLNKLSKVSFSKKSFNNKFGVPLSIFNASQLSKFIVLEAGMDKKGEINSLTKLIKPEVGLITNISFSHIANFKNLKQIADAKSEIINNIIPDGILVLNRDDKYFNYLANKANQKKLNVVSFSKYNKKADVCLLDIKKKNINYIFKIKIKNEKKSFLIPKKMLNFEENILASLCIIANFFDLKDLKQNIFVGFEIPKSRGSTIIFKNKEKKITIIDESYNSNPLSFKHALNNFDILFKNKQNKFILVGDMLELGKYSKKLHVQISKYINKSRINKVYTIGKFTKHTFNKLRPQIRGKVLNKNEDVLKLINKELPHNSFLMVKGSNATGLNKILQSL